jgi:Sec-independent protein translocase protein TatA
VVNKWIKEYKNNMEKEEVVKERKEGQVEEEEEQEELAILKSAALDQEQAYDRDDS